MREIEIQATISRSLYREMVYFQMFRRKRTTLPFGIVAYLLAAGTVIAKLTGYYTVDSYAFGMFTFYACVIYLFFPPVLIGLLEYQIHRMSTGNKTVVGQSHRIVFNENGVASYVGKAAGKFTWKQVLEAYELKNAFLFYISQSQALALAKSDATPEEQQAIRELAQEHATLVSSSPRDWMGYMDTAARLYRYPFTDQLLIHAQHPQATACASLEL